MTYRTFKKREFEIEDAMLAGTMTLEKGKSALTALTQECYSTKENYRQTEEGYYYYTNRVYTADAKTDIALSLINGADITKTSECLEVAEPTLQRWVDNYTKEKMKMEKMIKEFRVEMTLSA